MRIRDWSSDVCSSDLEVRDSQGCPGDQRHSRRFPRLRIGLNVGDSCVSPDDERTGTGGAFQQADKRVCKGREALIVALNGLTIEIGRAACRERVLQDVRISVVALSLKKKIKKY